MPGTILTSGRTEIAQSAPRPTRRWIRRVTKSPGITRREMPAKVQEGSLGGRSLTVAKRRGEVVCPTADRQRFGARRLRIVAGDAQRRGEPALPGVDALQ